jgi:Putative amidoligase enzyme
MSAVSERRFGVEIEHGFPGGIAGARECVEKAKLKGVVHSIGVDGSGVELRTQPLQGQEGFDKLRRLMDALREGGGYVTRADGMHVHHECRDYNQDRSALVRLVRQWVQNQPAIDQLVDAGRRKNGCAPKWSKAELSALEMDKGTVLHGPRGTLNLSPLSRPQQTIEIRQHEGTLDPETAQAWIAFCQGFLDRVIQGEAGFHQELADRVAVTKATRSYKTCRGLVDYLGLPEDVKARLIEKAQAEREARGKSRMLTLTQARARLDRDGGLSIAQRNDQAMGPLPGEGNAPPIDAGDIE